MPKVFEWKGYVFFFFSNEGFPLEPCHIHVRKDGNLAKFWVSDNVELDSSFGMTSKELNVIEGIVKDNIGVIREKWNEYFVK